MSEKAEKLIRETGEWKAVCAVDLDEIDKGETYRCISCKAPASLAVCTSKDNYFFSLEHALECPVAKGHKVINLNTRTEIDLTAILDYTDKDLPEGKKTPKAGEEDDNEFDMENSDDSEYQDIRLNPNAIATIRSAKGMYNALVEKCGSDYMDSITAVEVDAIFLRRSTFRKLKEDWGIDEKLVVTKRCVPKHLKYHIPVPDGYAILRDAYSRDDEDAIYFMVKVKHPAHDKKFKLHLFGERIKKDNGEVVKGVGKDRHRNIVLFAQWKRVAHKHYRIYRADLNSRQIAFVNAPDAF